MWPKQKQGVHPKSLSRSIWKWPDLQRSHLGNIRTYWEASRLRLTVCPPRSACSRTGRPPRYSSACQDNLQILLYPPHFLPVADATLDPALAELATLVLGTREGVVVSLALGEDDDDDGDDNDDKNVKQEKNQQKLKKKAKQKKGKYNIG